MARCRIFPNYLRKTSGGGIHPRRCVDKLLCLWCLSKQMLQNRNIRKWIIFSSLKKMNLSQNSLNRKRGTHLMSKVLCPFSEHFRLGFRLVAQGHQRIGVPGICLKKKIQMGTSVVFIHVVVAYRNARSKQGCPSPDASFTKRLSNVKYHYTIINYM